MRKSLIFLVVLIIFFVYNSVYIVDETEQVVITQFGKVMGQPKTDPGINVKIPFIQHANYFPKYLLFWDGNPGQVPTKDKTYIWIDTFARWSIVDPVKFFQTVNNEFSALRRLDDIIDPAVRNLITSHRLIETVRNTDREMDTLEDYGEDGQNNGSYKSDDLATTFNVQLGRALITKMILEQAKPKLDKFGIELVDVRIKRINYVDKVRESVYKRMIAERRQIAEKFRAEGQGEAEKIRGQTEKELKGIESSAYKTAQITKGIADAKATKIFAEAYSKDPDFYSFMKSLEVYSQSLGDKSSLILSTDSEFLKYLKNSK